MKLYHRTTDPVTILRDGFRGRSDLKHFRGVWFAEYPLDALDSIKGTTVLSIEIPEEEIVTFEVEQGRSYREWCIPAEVVNRLGPPTIHDDDVAPMTEAKIAVYVARLREKGNPHQVAEADAIEARLPLLIAHGVLEKEESEEDAEP